MSLKNISKNYQQEEIKGIKEVIQPTYYTVFPPCVRYDERLKADEKIFYTELHQLATMKGYCKISYTYFSKLYGVSRQTVIRWVNNLEKYGYIEIQIIYKDDLKTVVESRICLINTERL